MTRSATLLFFAIAMIVICLPAAVVSFGRQASRSTPETETAEPDEREETERGRQQVRLFKADQGTVITMDLEDYLVGVVMAEMPASFELEALKAQAVVARTYTMHRHRSTGGVGCSKAPEPADICTDSTHCQAWFDPEKGSPWWPEEKKEEYHERITQAVVTTEGEVVTYHGSLIEAVYHSTCGGQTEESSAIWSGGSVPYLKSVECNFCNHSPTYRQEVLIPYARLASSLNQQVTFPVATGGGAPIKVEQITSGGRVGKLRVNNEVYDGKDVRRLLELPSTYFAYELKEEGLLLHTRGHGHGVGLCQYGADGAAAQGHSYKEIISTYYPGAAVSVWPY